MIRTRSRILLTAALVVVSVALAAGPASAQYLPDTVGPTKVLGEGVVSVTGSGCAVNATITITVYHESPEALAGNPTTPPVITQTVTTDADGNFSLELHLPAGLSPGWYDVLGPCAGHSTRAAGEQLHLIGRFEIVTSGGTVAPGGTGVGGGSLPRTGFDFELYGRIGVGLLLAGGFILVATKRRRHGRADIQAA